MLSTGPSWMQFAQALSPVPGDPDGCVEFGAVFDLLDKAGYTGWIMVEAEQDPAKANPFEYAKMGREYITAHTGLGGEVVLKK